jgi:hypothetical protein
MGLKGVGPSVWKGSNDVFTANMVSRSSNWMAASS